MAQVKTSESQPISDSHWQDPKRPPIDDLKQALELRARTNQPMDGFALAREDLSELNLVNSASKQGYQLINADLYRCNLENAHLFMIDLSGSSLMKANLTNANLHYANLENCNLLGINLTGAKIENTHWGTSIIQEQQAQKTTDRSQQIELYQEAEEVYRNLRQTAEHQGLFYFAGHFFSKEMVMRRRQQPKLSIERITSKLVDVFCGYGEKPLRVIVFSIFLIVIFATLYFFTGLSFNDSSLVFSMHASLWENSKTYVSALYFSVITFTTLGYGDITPLGVARALAALEAFMGSFTLALFVVVFVKKMTR